MDPLLVACARLGGQEINIRALSTHPRTNKCGILTSQMLADQAGSQGKLARAAWRKDNRWLGRGETHPVDETMRVNTSNAEIYRSRKLTSIGVIVAIGVPLGPTAGLKRQVRTASTAFSSSPRPAPFTT